MKYVLAFASICALLSLTACSQSPQKLIAAGNRYHAAKKYNEASILYQKAITKDKTNADAYYRQGLNLLDAGSPVEAAKFLRRAVDLNANNSDAEAKLGEIYLSAYGSNPKRFKTLLPEIQDLDRKILQHQPDSFNGVRLQALLQLAEGDKDKALQSFARALQIKPYSPDVVGWYAEALASVNRVPEAESLVRDMLAHDPKWGPGYDFLFILYSRQNDRPKAEAVLRERAQKNPSNVIALQNLANYLVVTNRFDEAESIIRRVADDKKTFPDGRQILGDFYFRTKKFDQALQQFQAGLKEDPKHAIQYQERIVNVYQATNRRSDALQLAKTLAEKNPKDASASEIYAALLLQNGSATSASSSVNEMKTLIQNNPADPALHLQLARAYFGTNAMDKALTEALEAMQGEAKSRVPRSQVLLPARIIAARIYEDRGQHGKALEQTNVILASQPKNPDARLIRDRALIGTNEVDTAQSDLEALSEEFPRMNDAKLQLASIYLGQRQYDKASVEYEKVWQSTPPDARGFLGLQTIKLSQGKGDEAVQNLQLLAQKNPKTLGFRYELANFEASAGVQDMRADPAHGKQLFQQAADNYKEILKTTANSPDVWLRLGVLQRELGQYDAALASFEQAGNADPHRPDAFLNRAMLLEALGKKKEATDAYNKVLGIDSDNPLALNNLAFLAAENGTNLDQAMTFAERAKKKVPNSPDVSDTLGFVYYKKNLNSEALQIFRQVVKDNPQNPTFHFHLAMALKKQGDLQGARDEGQKALKNSSQPAEQDRIRSFLTQIGE